MALGRVAIGSCFDISDSQLDRESTNPYPPDWMVSEIKSSAATIIESVGRKMR